MLKAQSTARFVPAALAFVALASAAVGCLAPEMVGVVQARITSFAEGAGPGGWIVLVLLQVTIAASGLLPASLIGVLAGALYGPVLGFALASVGTIAGAWLSFALARHLKPSPNPLARSRIEAIQAALARGGWQAVCLLRLSPVMPFALTSWALGFSGISSAAYLAGTVAAQPALLVFVLIGSAGRVGLNASTQGVLLTLGLAATCAVLLWLRRALARETDSHTLERPSR
ncbi:VTT domain-containing protein [Methylobacterium organophilum]|uniref:TVP38/TMEM64 family protein n=1 Tax=Methylobacterium organophilum TaxID=410 RepID=UPI001F1343CE|nr:VTT domain-containing protein [Methylobacterium organophilum]UMY19160.1 VTT domain-containing protein [Methylobacterium organophilum]